MPDRRLPKTVVSMALIVWWATGTALAQVPAETPWKAGVATVRITPSENIWMAGYASRTKPSEGVAQDLFAKALALQDPAGQRLVVVTTDLIGIPRPLRDAVAQQAEQKHRLPPQSLLLNASHTHCGPELRASKAALYGIEQTRVRQAESYIADLQDRLVALIGESLGRLQPARLAYSHARCGFAMNRRLPTDRGYQNSPYPEGPVDHDVPVLRVEAADGTLRAVLFGYACHNTTLSFYQFCGDYAGYAQQYLEAEHPGMSALFLLGCGGDQNPYPRGKLEQAQQHGRALANAVEAALLPKARSVSGRLRVALDEVELQFATPPSRDELLQLKESKDAIDRRRAERLLDQLDRAGRIHDKYPYPIHAVQLGNELLLVALAGETVVDYALRLRRELSRESDAAIWIAGYSNDVFGYVPSLRVLREGGYEGGGAMRFSALPGPFAESVEERIVGKVHELVRRVRGAATGARNSDAAPAEKTSAAAASNRTRPAGETAQRTVRIAGIVLKWLRTDKEANFRRVEPMIRAAAKEGARIVATTECFLDGYAIADKSIPLDRYRALGERVPDGDYCRRLAKLAGELDVYLVAGMLEADGDARYNTAVLFGRDGRFIGKYRKQKLGHELERNTPGFGSPVFETEFGRLGLIICADRTEASIVQPICAAGADFLVCPSGGVFGPKSNDPIVQARSRENGIHIVFVHPAEFLVTGPDGAIRSQTVLGDRLLIDADQQGTTHDLNRVFYFDMPLTERRQPAADAKP